MDLISRQAAIDAVYKCTDIFINNLPVMVDKADAYKALAALPSAQPEIIRCKECKHRPKTDGKKYGFDVEFPDEICPVYCDDEYYNWMPDDDFYCARAKRRTDESDDIFE